MGKQITPPHISVCKETLRRLDQLKKLQKNKKGNQELESFDSVIIRLLEFYEEHREKGKMNE